MNSTIQSDKSDRWCLLILAISVAIVFGRACGFEFVSWDDQFVISGNPNLLNPTWGSLLQIWKSPDPGLYIPLTYTLWWMLALISRVNIDNGLTGLNPWIFHTSNVIVHLAAVLLVFKLLRELKFDSICSCGGAMIFALHPLQVESVAWATGMRDVLGGALAILALLVYLRGRFVVAAVVMLLATLAKPSSIMLLPMVLALDVLWFGLPWKQSLRTCWAMGIVAVVGAALTLWAQPQIHANISLPWQRPLIAMDAVAFYLYKLFVPVDLVFDYSRKPSNIVASGQIWWTWFVPVMVGVAAVLQRSRAARVASLWFVLPLLPVLGLIPFAFQSISTVADHYAYLAMVGPAILLAIVAASLSAKAQVAAIAIVILGLGTVSFHQVSAWSDDTHLFEHATRINVHSAPAWNGLAGLRYREERYREAEAAAKLAIEADPDYAAARFTMIGIKMRLGDNAGVDAQMREFLRTYQNQANFDPKLAEAMKAKIEQMKQR